MKIRANGIGIEIEDTGPGADGEARPTVLLIMGLGMQLVAWPDAWVQALVDAGFRVLRLDNRDAGLSEHMSAMGRPNIVWEAMKMRLGLAVKSPYSLQDMAHDALGVLDVLGIAQAHVVGLSMGGMIAQRLALSQPTRVRSLCSIMSSSGARGLPQARPEVMRALLSRPDGRSAEAVENHYVNLFRVIGSPAYPTPEASLRERIRVSAQRSFDPAGTLRQMAAIMADRGRASLLAGIRMPTLVMHGRADPLVPFSHGEDTARRIPGAQLVAIDGMGHDLPPGVLPQLLGPLITHMHAA
jgi:pimeloyl-ACP methyl ester carboxylesterase